MKMSIEESEVVSTQSLICRLCLANDANEYGSIYDEYDGMEIIRIIVECIGIEVRKNDGLTKAVCRNCCNELIDIDKTRKRCIQSDKILRDMRMEEQALRNRPFVGPGQENQRKGDFYELESSPEHHRCNTYPEEGLLLPEEQEELKKEVYEMHLQEEFLDLPEAEMNDEDIMAMEDAQYSPSTSIEIQPAEPEPYCNGSPADTQPKFVCCGCPSSQFGSDEQLLTHRTEQHEKYRILDNSIRPFECDTCYQRFLSAKLLHHHKTRPYRKRSHVCKSCGLAYFTSCALRRHETVCSIAEKNFSCEECGKRFREMLTLSNHQKLHRASKAFACPVCGKTFKKKFEISIHMVTHSTEQPYPCDHCPARFKRKHALKNHQRHHANARPYKCDMCDEWFNSFAARKFHRQTVHEGLDPFRCEQCGGSYGRRLRLRQHMKKAHGLELNKHDKGT